MKKKRIIAWALAASMAFTTVPANVFAEDVLVSEETSIESSTEEAVAVSDDDASAEVASEIISEDAADEVANEAVEAPVEGAEVNGDVSVNDVPVFVDGQWTSGSTSKVGVGAAAYSVEKLGDDSVRMSLVGANKGKLSGGNDEYPYYLKKIPASENFTFTATATVHSMNNQTGASNFNQASFGLVVLNEAYEYDSGNVGAHTPYTESVYCAAVPESNAATANTRFVSITRLAHNDSGQAATRTVGTTNLSPDQPFLAKGTDLGTFNLTIKKSGNAYVIKCGNNSETVVDENNFMADDIFVGCFVARDADVTFSNMSLVTSSLAAKSIIIEKGPDQTVYHVGEKFNKAGMKVKAIYEDDSEAYLEEDDFVITNFDSSEAGNQTIYAGAAGAKTGFDITIRPIKVKSIKLTNLPIDNTFGVDSLFNAKGAVASVTFEDNSTKTVPASDLSFYLDGKELVQNSTRLTSSMIGSHALQVYHAKTKNVDPNNTSTQYNVSVKAGSYLNGIKIVSKPIKLDYFEGDKFTSEGLYVYGQYSDNTDVLLQPSEYTLSEVDLSKPGTKTVTVTSTFNPNFKASFVVTVSALQVVEMTIGFYPKTTYTVGEKFDASDLVVNYNYNSGAIVKAKEGIRTKAKDDNGNVTSEDEINKETKNYVYTEKTNDYTLDISDFTAKKVAPGTAVIKVIPTNSAYKTMEFPVTIQKAKEHVWRSTVFGQSSSGITEGDAEQGKGSIVTVKPAENKGTVKEGTTITVKSWGGSGKITGDHDGIAYYYTAIDPKENFSLTADVYVRGYLGADAGPYNNDEKRSGQEAFGLMARDVIPLKPNEQAIAEGDIMVINPARAKKDEGGPVPFDYADKNSAVFASNMAIAGGFSGGSWPADKTAASYEKNAHINRINLVARKGVVATNGGGEKVGPQNISDYETGFPKAGIYEGDGMKINGNPNDETRVGDKFRITLRYANVYKNKSTGEYKRSVWARCEDLNSGKVMETYLKDDDLDHFLTTQDASVAYVGFFAARWAVIDVTNVEFYTSNPATDGSVAKYTEDPVDPKFELKSSLYSTRTNYNFIGNVNTPSGGFLTVKQGDKVIYKDIILKKGNFTLPITLEENKTNHITTYFTPNSKDYLVNYNEIVRSYEIVHKPDFTKSEYVYVSPNGSSSNDGTRENPTTLKAALGFIDLDQTIVMLEGTYLLRETLTIPNYLSAVKGRVKSLIADPQANTRPVLDFNREGSGVVLAANYWYLKGFDVIHSADQQSGFNVSGQHCTIEDVKVHDNGGTGMQVSRSSATQETFDSWPAHNLILNCEAYNNADSSKINADGFAAKLTVGNGNVFKGCYSHHNVDDGWDLYTKLASGAIGPVVLEDCIAYRQGYQLLANGTEKEWGGGGHNGYKLGGENIPVMHYLKDSITIFNETNGGTSGSGVSSNSNPNMKIRNVVAFGNTLRGLNLYSDAPKLYNYDIKGAISFNNGLVKLAAAKANAPTDEEIKTYGDARKGSVDRIGGYLNKDENLEPSFKAAMKQEKSNYLVRTALTLDETIGGKTVKHYRFESTNIDKDVLNPEEVFVSIDPAVAISGGRIAQDDNGVFQLNGFLQRKVPYAHESKDLITLPGCFVGNTGNNGGDGGDTPTTEKATETTTKAPNKPNGGSSSSSGGGRSSSNAASSAAEPSVDHSNNNDSATNEEADNKDDATSSNSKDNSSSNNNNSTGSSSDTNSKFNDTAVRPWAEASINKLTDEGILNGVGGGKFNPDGKTKRADFAIVLVRLLGLSGSPSSNFSDVSSSKYYANAVGLAKESGIINGVGANSFAPETTISRQDTMVIIARALEKLGIELDSDVSVLSKFNDSNDISSYAAPYVAALINAGIVTGNGANINSLSDITRAEMAVIIDKVNEFIKSSLTKEVVSEDATEAEEITEETESDSDETVEADTTEDVEEVTEA